MHLYYSIIACSVLLIASGFRVRGSATYKLSRNNDLERLEPLGRNLVVIAAVRVHATADGQKMTGIREPARDGDGRLADALSRARQPIALLQLTAP